MGSGSWDTGPGAGQVEGRERGLGVSGEKGKDGSEKGRELKERNFLFSSSPLPHLKSPLP